jgi:subtilisin-like proprotein convertase family protein
MRIRLLLLFGAVLIVLFGNAESGKAQEPPDWDPDRPIGPSSTYGSQSFFDTIVAPIGIPDATGSISNSTVVTDAFPIVDLDVHVDITHTWVGDLIITLTHVDTGTSVTVFDRPGSPPGNGCNADNILTALDDEAASPVEAECSGAPPAIDGTFTPNFPLSAFDGESTAGTWTLQVSDVAVNDLGTLDAWQINVRGSELVDASAPFVPIPDAPAPGASDSILVTNKGTVTDLNLVLVIGHTYVGDIVITIEHEETGTTVTLVDRPGYPSAPLGCSGNNINALLDDEAPAPIESQCGGGVPSITGNFTPNNPLSAFDGEALGGTWTLTATDLVSQDTGEITFWALSFTGEGCPAGTNLNFEQGATDSPFIPCWTTVNQPGSSGAWCTQSGLAPPNCGDQFFPAPSPPQGTKAAMTDQGFYATNVMYRCGIPTLGGLRFSLYLRNAAPAGWITQPSLDFTFGGGDNNQQFRADIVSRDGILSDPFTVAPQHILMNLYQSQPLDPTNTLTYSAQTYDISAFIGQTVCLRFAVVAGVSYLNAGIDDVIFQVKEPKLDPDQDTVQNDVDSDDDSDGCTDAQESQGTIGSEVSGGRRNPHNFWDFYDVPAGVALTRDLSVSALDIFAVIGRFGTTGNPNIDPLSMPATTGYHTAYDRGGSGGPHLWSLNPANGSIAAADIFSMLAQFTHTCA